MGCSQAVSWGYSHEDIPGSGRFTFTMVGKLILAVGGRPVTQHVDLPTGLFGCSSTSPRSSNRKD